MENEKVTIPKKKGKMKWIIIAVILVLFIAIASSGSPEPAVEPIDSSATQTTKSPTQEIKVGSSVSNDQVKISFKSCNSNFKNYSRYADLKSGHKVIEAVFDFENISTVDISLNGFDCYADGVKCESFYSVDNYSSPLFETISAGRKLANVTIYYEVPADSESIELEYESDFWNNEKYIFIVE